MMGTLIAVGTLRGTSHMMRAESEGEPHASNLPCGDQLRAVTGWCEKQYNIVLVGL